MPKKPSQSEQQTGSSKPLEDWEKVEMSLATGHLGRYVVGLAYKTDCGLLGHRGKIFGVVELDRVDCRYCLRQRIWDYGRQTWHGALIRRLAELGG